MGGKDKEDDISKHSISLDDDEQDEDFVASEIEDDSDGDGSDSDDSSEEGSDDEDEGNARRRLHAAQLANDKDFPNDAQATLMQALEGDRILEEPILSDSDISKEFPEEEDDVLAALAGSDYEDDEDEDEVSSQGPEMSKGSAGTVPQAVSLVAAQSAAAPAGRSPSHRPRTRSRLGAAAAEEGDHPGTSQRPNDAEDVPSPGVNMRRNRSLNQSQLARPDSPPMEVFGAVLPNLDDDDPTSAVPIAQRTRAHLSLMDFSIEQLEAALGPATEQEELLKFGIDDSLEYERFLANLQQDLGGGGGLDGHGTAQEAHVGALDTGDTEIEDSDDEDFVMELARMVQEDQDAAGLDLDLLAGGTGTEGLDGVFRLGGRKRRSDFGKKRKPPKPPRRSARLLKSAADRPRFISTHMDRRNAQATNAIIQRRTNAEAPTQLFEDLDELASLAAALEVGPPVLLPSDLGKATETATAQTVVWQPPLPKAIRRGGGGGGGAKVEHTDPIDDSIPPIAGLFATSQYANLYLLIHQHGQLLCQTAAMATAIGDMDSAESASKMLRDLVEFVRDSTIERQNMGVTPYVAACLGIGVNHGGTANFGGGAGQGSKLDILAWSAQNPGDVYTVADVAVLRGVPEMLRAMPTAAEAAAAAAAAAAVESEGGGGTDTQAPPSEQGAEGKPKKRRSRVKMRQHPIWSKLPAGVRSAIAPVRRFFDPALEPIPPQFSTSAQLQFTPAEDHLLAWGIRKYYYEWKLISENLLPTKPEKVLFNRKKNRVSGAAPDNIVKQTVSLITGDLTPAEEALIEKALEFYGKQRKRWEIICKDHLPYRHPHVLSMKWSERMKNLEAGTKAGAGNAGEGSKKTPKKKQKATVQPGLLSDQPAATQQQQVEQAGPAAALLAPSGAFMGAAYPNLAAAAAATSAAMAAAAAAPALLMPPPQMSPIAAAAAFQAAAAASMQPNPAVGYTHPVGVYPMMPGIYPMSPAALLMAPPQQQPVKQGSRELRVPQSPNVLGTGARGGGGGGGRASGQGEAGGGGKELDDDGGGGGRASRNKKAAEAGGGAKVQPRNFASHLQDILTGRASAEDISRDSFDAAAGAAAEAEAAAAAAAAAAGNRKRTRGDYEKGSNKTAVDILEISQFPPEPPVWTSDEDRILLRAAIQSGGTLDEEKLGQLALQLHRSAKDIEERCKMLVERFRAKAREKKQAEAAQK